MPLKGICRVYEDGLLVAEANNLVTSYGKTQIPIMLAGRGAYVSHIGIGASTTGSLSHIEAEIAKAPIVFATPFYRTTPTPMAVVTYKARLADAIEGVINEISLYNSATGGNTIVNLGDVAATTGGTIVDGLAGVSTGSANVRMSGSARSIPSGQYAEVTKECSAVGARGTEKIVVSGYNATSSATQATVTLLLTDVYGVTASAAFAFANNSTDYQSIGVTIGTFTNSSTFSWGNIVKARFTVSGGGPAVVVDGMTLRSDTIGGLALTRATYGAPVVKRKGSRMDVEYELGLTL